MLWSEINSSPLRRAIVRVPHSFLLPTYPSTPCTHTHSRTLTYSHTDSGPCIHLLASYKTVKTHICNVFLTKQKKIHGNLSSYICTPSQAVWSCLFRLLARALRTPCPSGGTQAKPHADLQSDNAIILLYISLSSHRLAKLTNKTCDCFIAGFLVNRFYWIWTRQLFFAFFFFFYLPGTASAKLFCHSTLIMAAMYRRVYLNHNHVSLKLQGHWDVIYPLLPCAYIIHTK